MLRRIVTVGLGSALLALAACGDDDDSANEEYCDLARELAAEDETPSDDPRLDEYIDLAPEEIRDDAALAIQAITERGDAAFEDDEVLEAVADIEAFELEECGIERPGGGDEDGEGDDGDDGGGTPATDETDEPDDADATDGETTSTVAEATTTTQVSTTVTTP